jgi:drug/metabolite transporter (DMT)-like permease
MRLRIAAALGTVYVLWGSTYLGIRVAIDDLPPLTMLAIRFLVAGALLYAWARPKHPAPDGRAWASAAVVGTGLLAVGTGAVAWAELHLDSGLVALIVAMVPLWLAVIDRTQLSGLAVLGLALGFGGVAALAGPGSEAFTPAALVVVAGTLGWAGASILARNAPVSPNGLGAAMQMLCGGAVLALAGAARGELGDVRMPSLGAVAAVAYLVVFGSLVAFTAYTWLLRNAPTSLVGTYAFVNPVVAVLLGTVFLGEPLALRTVVAGSVIVAGVALIVAAPKRGYSQRREVVQPALGQAQVR